MTGLQVDMAVELSRFRLRAVLEAPAGETVVVLGPNGAGKTTLLAAVAGFLPLQSGRIVAQGHVWDDVAVGVRVPPGQRGCGFVFQDLRLFPALKVVDNVAFGLRARKVDRNIARRRAVDILRTFSMEEYADRRVGELSGGQRQRVALARALAIEPTVLLLDEALSSLDAEMRAGVRRMLRHAQLPETTVRLVVTHDPAEAFGLGNRVVVVEEGRVTWSGNVSDLAHAPASPFLATLRGINVFRGRVERVEGQTWLEAGGRRLVVADTDVAVGAEAMGTFPATAVTLATAPPQVSARNVFPGLVTDLTMEGAAARVRVDAAVPLTASVTSKAVAELSLRPGSQVWAYVKATEIRVDPL